MAHFAELDSNNVVKQVIVVSDKDTSDITGAEDEQIGISYLKGLFGEHTLWKQTSYNGSIRKRYAGKGFVYNEEYDAFIPPQTYSSWIFDTETLDWNPPTARPEETEEMRTNGQMFYWDEEAYARGENGGWMLSDPVVTPTETESA